MTNVDGEYQFEVISTSGDTHLGGEDFDSLLINFFIDEFKKESGFDLNKDPMALQRLKEAAEKAKIELSTTDQTEVNLPYITADASGPKHFVQKITRAKLESLVGDLVTRSLEPVKTALKDAKLSPKDINDVILVGGQTRMPMCSHSRSSSKWRKIRCIIVRCNAFNIGNRNFRWCDDTTNRKEYDYPNK